MILEALAIAGTAGAVCVSVYRLYRWLKLKREEKERVFDHAGM